MDKGEHNLNGRGAVAPAASEELHGPGSRLAPALPGLPIRNLVDRLRTRIGFRLLAAVLLFSSAVTLTLTALQLYLDYDHEVGVIETRLDEIGRSYRASLGESLWALDRNQLQLQLNGILRLPGIRAAEISEVIDRPDPIHILVGDRSAHASIAREYPLDYIIRGKKSPIGTLYVEATLSEVYRNLLNRTLVILTTQAAKTFLVSLFILYIVHLFVTRHLITIAGFAKSYSVVRPPPPLQLNRRPQQRPDELDDVADAFNALFANLQRAYGELQQVNAQLQRDLMVRQKAEQDAHLSEQRFRDYAETASDWFWETGPDHRFTYISERVEAFGLDRAAFLGRSRLEAAIDGGAEPEKWRAHHAALDRREPFRNFEYTRRDRAGGVHHISVSGRPVFAPDGRFVGYRGTGTDLTRQHETEERLRQSQKMDAIGQLTGGVAHDFNNMLTVITGTIEILQEGVADRPELAAITELIDEAAVRGAAITSQLLTFARRQPLRPREVDINALVADTAKLLKPMLGEHIEISSRLASDAWSALADPAQLSAAIVNLAVNARDAMPDGGRLTLTTANAVIDEVAWPDGEIRTGEFVTIAVADTGQGISSDIIDRVFEPFFTTKEMGRGTGLGLAMVYGFAKQTGGTAKVESEPGRGTVVTLFLPRSAGQAVSRPEAAPVVSAVGGHETILVVEDDPLVRGYVIAQLGGLGYRTLIASDAEAALALVDQGVAFDLLFTDVVMPGMNGRQLAEAVLKRRPGMKVLYTSGYTDEFVHDGRLDAGIALLRKPYRKADLSRKIREVLAGGNG